VSSCRQISRRRKGCSLAIVKCFSDSEQRSVASDVACQPARRVRPSKHRRVYLWVSRVVCMTGGPPRLYSSRRYQRKELPANASSQDQLICHVLTAVDLQKMLFELRRLCRAPSSDRCRHAAGTLISFGPFTALSLASLSRASAFCRPPLHCTL